ncbi:Gfo/Idh/MocA family protein [Sutcliffiella cohnii]
MLKIAVIGLGDISQIHIPAIQANPNVQLVAVCDIDETKNVYDSSIQFYTDYESMLKNESLDCVHICLPHYLHYPVTKTCVEHGVNVFLEKPLGLNEQEGLELVKLEEANPNVKICVCFQNRFNETFEMLYDAVQTEKYGKVLGVKGLVTWYRPKSYYETKPWRGQMDLAGGGVMINQALHTVDLMQLLGGEIESIKGSIDQLLDYNIEVEDTATARIQFRNGATGLFFATNSNYGNSSVELQVIFEHGKLTIKDSILTRVDDEGKKERLIEDSRLPGTKFYYGASHMKLIHHFYKCIANDTNDYIHAKDALPSLTIIDAIRKSSETNKRIQMEG